MILKGRKIIGGKAEGEAITSTEGISFYGSVDVKSGKVVEKDHPLEGQCITKKIPGKTSESLKKIANIRKINGIIFFFAYED